MCDITFCEFCDHVVENTRKKPGYLRLCVKHPNIWNGYGYVTKTEWDKREPYLRCIDVNGGACLLFEPEKEHSDG